MSGDGMTASLGMAGTRHRAQDAAARDGLPPVLWLAALAAALWPHWLWMAGRWRDGSDDPLGLAALLAVALSAPRYAARMTRQVSGLWLTLALAACVAATAALFFAPPLVGALLAALTLAAASRALLPAGQPSLALGGLLLLALPLISSLQFYAGFPLRIATAQLSTWLLQAFGAEAQRSGAAMLVNGRLIIVDAPCSGVQMVWMAYFCACAAALWAQQPNGVFLRRLAGVGAIVLAGNVLRNSVLVLLEAQPAPVAAWLHQGVGLMVLAMVCTAVVSLVGRKSHGLV